MWGGLNACSLRDLVFPTTYPLKRNLKSDFKPYISAPQIKPKQFYNGAKRQAPLTSAAVEGYCALQVLPDVPPPLQSVSQDFVCVFAFFFLKHVFRNVSVK